MDHTCFETDGNTFLLKTAHTSYLMRVDESGHLHHIHYGRSVNMIDADALAIKNTVTYGDAIEYQENAGVTSLDQALLEWSSHGRGDFRRTPIEGSGISSTSDFLYAGYDFIEGSLSMKQLPNAHDGNGSLIIHLKDKVQHLALDLVYGIYHDADVITRRTVLKNEGETPYTVSRLMSFSLDTILPHAKMMTFHGSWANEMNQSVRDIEVGTLLSGSTTGFSSSRNNPGFLIYDAETGEDHGDAWGFNLVWSGSHETAVIRNEHDEVRIMSGLSSENLHWKLESGEAFETPEAFMTYSAEGLNGVSHHFHSFILNHIERSTWTHKERPVLVNDWEAFLFSFNEDSLVSLAAEGKKLGAELFVLDDGWFGARNHDRAGLGDYNVNPDKLPHGIRGLSDRIHDLGMMFGLWFEPEAINPDSDLYRAHPEWVMHDMPYRNLLGRHENLLDLTNPQVRDYIVENVGRTLDEGNVDYVKWDMNRQMTGRDMDYDYRYICGLYEVLDRIFTNRPHILLESCSSGGGRFDAGMMCFSPQIWGSDDTDPMERLHIQKSYSYLYPQSTVGAHVSHSPNAQTLRATPLHTRFHTAAYGVLGYEMDVRAMKEWEKEEAKREIAFYREHRKLLQFGTFCRVESDEKHEVFAVYNDEEAIITTFRRMIPASSAPEVLHLPFLDENAVYSMQTREFLMEKGEAPKELFQAEGTYWCSENGSEAILYSEDEIRFSGNAGRAGIPLNNVFNGSGYNRRVRLPQDFGSEMYVVKKLK